MFSIKKFYLIIFIFFLIGCGSILKRGEKAPKFEITPISYDNLILKINDIIKNTDLKGGKVGILVEDFEKGNALYSKNENDFFKPASCNKLLTTSSAFHYLGTDFRYKTNLCYKGTIKDNMLEGDLIVVGSGDPSFSARFSKNPKDTTIIFKEWAGILKKKKIKRVTGNIIGDDDIFDDVYFYKGWYPWERAEWYEAEVSGLSFNDNCIDIYFKWDDVAGQLSSSKISPDTSYVSFNNDVKTTDTKSYNISYKRGDKSNEIYASGVIPVRRAGTEWVTIYNPTLFCVTVLKETLQREGITVDGEAIDIDDLKDKAPFKEELQTIAVHKSPPLPRLINVINRISHNFFAEQIFKTLGCTIKGEGSFEKSSEAVQDFLKKMGIYKEGFVMVDGSGLSHLNRVSPRMFVDLLRMMRNSKEWELFLHSLPQGGERGSLKNRFNKSPEEKYLGKFIFGKTGYIGEVITLTGIITNQKGQDLFFSIMVNDYKCKDERVRKMVDEITLAFAKYHNYSESRENKL